MDPIDPIDPGTLEMARRARGLSRSALARAAGTDESTIHRIEAGKVDPKVIGTWAGIVRALRAAPLTTADAA